LPENFVLYLGGYDARKNVSALLHAFTWVSSTLHEDYPLVLAGELPSQDTRLFPNPLRIARELGIEKYIVTPGWIAEEDKPLLYAAATVFVYPSRYEGFGLPVLEAMACGTPVVTSNTSSLPEVVGDAALLIDPYDEAALAQAMLTISGDEQLRARLREAGLERARQFTWRATAEKTLALYREASSSSSPPRPCQP
jgi:glycosyltransferase involved in cell wall biosynthesis